MSRIVHFEIAASDPERLMTFYAQVLNWTFEKWDGPSEYWKITTGPPHEKGINGGLIRRSPTGTPISLPTMSFVCTASVDTLDETLAKVVAAGGTIVQSKFALPEIGWMAAVRDPEGHVLNLIEYDASPR